jgi:hypothetical protein
MTFRYVRLMILPAVSGCLLPAFACRSVTALHCPARLRVHLFLMIPHFAAAEKNEDALPHYL